MSRKHDGFALREYLQDVATDGRPDDDAVTVGAMIRAIAGRHQPGFRLVEFGFTYAQSRRGLVDRGLGRACAAARRFEVVLRNRAASGESFVSFQLA